MGAARPQIGLNRLKRSQALDDPSSGGFSYADSWLAAPVACGLPQAKELHAVLAPLLPRPPSPRSRRSPTSCEGHRAPGAPAPGEGAPTAGQAPQDQPSRPGPVRGGEPGDAQEQLVVVQGAAGDAAAVAPGTRPEEVDLPEDGAARPAADRPRHPRPRRPARPGDPAGDTSGSGGSSSSSGSGFPRRRSGRSCSATASSLPRAEAARRGPSSCGPRRRGSGQPTSSPSRRSASGRSTSCSSSSSPRGTFTWPV